MPKVIIDGRELQVDSGKTVLDAARLAGIVIPTICHHPDLRVDCSFRLFVVEVGGQSSHLAAAPVLVSEGMVVHTEPPALGESRKFVLEMLLRRYVDAGNASSNQDDTEFMDWVRRYGARSPDPLPPRTHAVDSD